MFTVTCHLVFKKAAPVIHHAVKHHVWRPIRKGVKHAIVHKKILATATLVCTVSGSVPYLSPAPAALPPLPAPTAFAALPQPLLGGGGFSGGGFLGEGLLGGSDLSEFPGGPTTLVVLPPLTNTPIGELPNIDFLKDFSPGISDITIINDVVEVPISTTSTDVPEPGTFGLVLLGVIATLVVRRKCSF
jgi:hypothetical protein